MEKIIYVLFFKNKKIHYIIIILNELKFNNL